jgi:SAM-dependent methyltransferase
MADAGAADVWATGAAYEPYIGRWSHLVARDFLPWLQIGAGRDWLDVGCGTGILTRAIVHVAAPRAVVGIDPSAGFVGYARARTADTRVHFDTGDARSLPFEAQAFDVVVSGLVLNFVSDPMQGVTEMMRVARSGGTVAAYIWDYADAMQMLRYFWDAAIALDPAALELDEGRRFPICQPQALRELFEAAGLTELEARAIEVPTRFRDFDDYWSPFLGGQGPAPSYVASLDEMHRSALRERLRGALPVGTDGSIHLVARAWAIRATREHARQP